MDLALSKKIEELVKENSSLTQENKSLTQENKSLTQENRMLKHQKDRFGINYITASEKGAAQSLLNGEIPFLKKIPELSLIKDDKDSDTFFEVATNTAHLLIEGDNLSALVALQHTHTGKIDVIYIDPPYNTGNKDFVYNDSFVSNDDGFRHSKWLSFMRPRLELAKKLLSETGVIFVSIDDNEQAALKMLMDSIFGEQNFIGNIIRKTKSTTNGSRNGFNQQHEYLLVYAKNSFSVHFQGKAIYKNPDNDPHGPWTSGDPTAKSGTQKNNWFAVINPYTGKEDFPPQGKFWCFSKNTINNHINNGTIVFKKNHKPTERGFIYKRHLKNTILNSLDTASNEYMNQVDTKGIAFIKHILFFMSKDAIVLDLFAGSGTTGHAVAELNAEDGGTRQAILITNSSKKASRLLLADFKKSVNALTDSQLSILKEKIIVDEQASRFFPIRTSPDKWGKTQRPFEIKKSGLFAASNGSPNQHYVRWQKICDYLEIENVFDPVNLASDATAERMKRVLTGKWFDGKKHNSLPGNLHYYKLELDNLTKDVYSIPDKINLQKYVGVVSLEENAHNILEQLPDAYKDGNNSIENNDAIVLSSDDKLILVYGNYDKALFADDDFINTVNNIKNFAEITNKVFKLYVVSTENEVFTIDNFVATPYPILYTTKVDKTVSALEKQGFLVKDVESS